MIGVKVTPTSLIGVTTDFTAGILRQCGTRISTTPTPEAVIEQLAGHVKAMMRLLKSGTAVAGPLVGIGIAVSGDVDAAARRGAGLAADGLARTSRSRSCSVNGSSVPVVVTNDVRALTVAEHWFGVGVNADSFAVVTIGSGIGCGLYINGEVVSGAYGVSGELGHLPLAPGDLVCTCGRRGCVETVASSDAILTRTRETTGRADLDLAGAIKLAHEGDEHAREAFDRAGEVIGAALAAMVNLVGPELVVIAGEGVAEYDLYEERMRQRLRGARVRCRRATAG